VTVALDRPLRIVQAAAFPFPSPQGSQVYVRGMARALARRGHHVTVACYSHGAGQVDHEYQVVRTPAVPGYRNVRAGPDLVKPFLDLALAVRLARLRADIVHAHNYEAPLAAVLSRLWTGVPVVYNSHNTMSEELHTYFDGRLAKAVARRVGAVLDHSVPRMADHAVAINARAVPVLQSFGCRAVSHVPPGIEPDDLPETRPAKLPPGPWVVYAGNPDRYQDLDVLVEAMRQVPMARLLLVSASPLDEFAACDLPGLRCVVTQDFAEVRSLIAAADVAALPRAVCSGYPIKLLNYLGMGVPTVAAEGSARDLPGVVVVPNRDPAAMACALNDLLRSPDHLQSLGKSARTHVLTRCTWQARAVELEHVYAQVLSRLDPARRRPLAL
jgi:glycosyltransferase involved in cell wall biosynthesis